MCRRLPSFVVLSLSLVKADAFRLPTPIFLPQQSTSSCHHANHRTKLESSSNAAADYFENSSKWYGPRASSEGTSKTQQNAPSTPKPQVIATGFSNKMDLLAALKDALQSAMDGIPPSTENIDLATVTVSSLYDGSSTSTPINIVVPYVLQEAVEKHNVEILNLVGCTSGGLVGSSLNWDATKQAKSSQEEREGREDDSEDELKKQTKVVIPSESEGTPGVSITLCVLPDVEISTFHLENDDVPDDISQLSPQEWRNAVGLRHVKIPSASDPSDPPNVFLIPSPAFHNELDNLLQGISYAIPRCQTFGAVASTVSSLSRARLFRYSKSLPNKSNIDTHPGGCVGVVFQGDVQFEILIAQGAKPVGGVYRIVSGEGTTIRALLSDETGAKDEESLKPDPRVQLPRPPLAEANYLLKNVLSDDDATFMRRSLLIGVERGGALGRSPNELDRLSRGEGHAFTVYQVATAGMKDGSVTLPLGSVDLKVGQRVRFFVREGDFAKREVNALWTGYKKRDLEKTFLRSNLGSDKNALPSGCWVFPSLDRGTKMFGGRQGYESGVVSEFLPSVPSISGFFANGVIGPLDGAVANKRTEEAMLHGSATCFAVISSKSNRPMYDAVQAKVDENAAKDTADKKNKADLSYGKSSMLHEENAPRSPDGELILRRREIHSGRALTVSTVEWSVAEKKAIPTSALEGWMWDKETEVDRYRERVPLANLLSQVKLSMVDPTAPKPRDWVGIFSQSKSFTIIPELKRSEPREGSLRPRYNPRLLAEEFVSSGRARALCVNCDGVMFGGSFDDITAVRMATTEPVLVSDLILYPYQLYQLRLAGADAVAFVAAALTSKDLLYLSKIASSLELQSVVSVSSEVQLERVISGLKAGSIVSLVVSNRNWEDFSVDESGEQALRILRSDTMALFKQKFGEQTQVLVEGRVGLIQKDGSVAGYIKALQESGAHGAVVGSALAATDETGGITL